MLADMTATMPAAQRRCGVIGRMSPRHAAYWTAAMAFLVVLAVDELLEIRAASLFASDFRVTLWEPARAVVHGTDPYANPQSVYPPSARAACVARRASVRGRGVDLDGPFSRRGCGDPRLLHVRDWRCYALWLLNAAVLSTAVTGNATVVVGLLLALTLDTGTRLAGRSHSPPGSRRSCSWPPSSSGSRSPGVRAGRC